MKKELKLPINSGVCECGHSWEDHHLSMIVNQKIWDIVEKHAKKPVIMYIPEECEHYGSNECGGLMPTPDGWVEHCNGYKDVAGPLIIEYEEEVRDNG